MSAIMTAISRYHDPRFQPAPGPAVWRLWGQWSSDSALDDEGSASCGPEQANRVRVQPQVSPPTPLAAAQIPRSAHATMLMRASLRYLTGRCRTKQPTRSAAPPG